MFDTTGSLKTSVLYMAHNSLVSVYDYDYIERSNRFCDYTYTCLVEVIWKLLFILFLGENNSFRQIL